MKHRDIIEKMTLEEKCAYLSGKNEWSTRAFPSLGIPALHHADGPNGIRKQRGEGDHLGINPSVPATCFPTSAALANSWDEELLERVGEGLGSEAALEDVNVVLGPGVNIKRNPLCGRNFEYFSEDPYISGKLAAAIVRGIQSKGVSACLKHFALNSQELRRMAMDSVADERTIREIYTTAFEIAIKESGAKAIMTSYNMVNGVYANENEHLLKNILRRDIGFDGMVVTDWGGSNDHVLGVKNGSSLEMPAPGLDSARQLLEALKRGDISETDIDDRVDELIDITLSTSNPVKPSDKEKLFEDNHHLAREAAGKSAVLLKNENKILPVKAGSSIAVIGDFAFSPRYQGAGSSMVNATRVETAETVLPEFELNVVGMAHGYSRTDQKDDASMIKEALDIAAKADIVLYFFGLNEDSESEGLDRTHLRIPENQVELLSKLVEVNENIVGIISAGSSIEMPWHHHLKAILHGYLWGQAGMGAIFDILCGRVNPSGKLTETILKKYEDVPNYNYYPSVERNSEYRESIFVGYRYFTTANIPVLYPFGYGLSYTEFAYSDIEVDDSKVSFCIENTGETAGEEVAQLYISLKKSDIFRAKLELKGFKKVSLAPKEKKRVEIYFDDKSFRFFNVLSDRFETESGEYDISIGSSCMDIRLSAALWVEGNAKAFPYNKDAMPSYFSGNITNVDDEEYRQLLGRDIPDGHWSGELEINDALCQMYYAKSPVARFIYNILDKRLKKATRSGVPDLNTLFQYNMPFRAIAKMSGGVVSMEMAESLLVLVNGHFFKGLWGFIAGFFRNKRANKEYESKYLQRED